ncbi:hypothetical protein MTR67_006829 [Solanum verrucosum]|uniref:CCHC-type domain-containing protein n=1 Tax=Solanum verrucosum TaxID=315347 RepID=A0AAF0Q4V2_SOLVR|nr:hypothetical protein MTR67_006829 [Solanum verrucosum]
MFLRDMDISRLMVYAQQIGDEKVQDKNREVKRARTGDGDLSNARSDVYGLPRFQKSAARKDGCYSCGNEGQKMRDCPILRAKGREAKKAFLRGLDSNAPKQA